jgi:hypothetical protein
VDDLSALGARVLAFDATKNGAFEVETARDSVAADRERRE